MGNVIDFKAFSLKKTLKDKVTDILLDLDFIKLKKQKVIDSTNIKKDKFFLAIKIAYIENVAENVCRCFNHLPKTENELYEYINKANEIIEENI